MRTVRVAITGVGNVGSRIVAALDDRSADFASRLGTRVLVSGVCARSGGVIDLEGITPATATDRTSFVPSLTGERFMREVDADVLIEAGPSDYADGGPGLEYLRTALSAGMDAICVSKGALVVAGRELHQTAATSGRQLRVSGAAASAMPTVDFLTYDLAGADVTGLEALLTGTTTFVLDSMHRQGLSFAGALAEAQARGIAEPEPEFDVDGWDTAAKLVVIARAAFGTHLRLGDIPRPSLSSISTAQLDEWRHHDLTPRLVGRLERADGRLSATVEVRSYPAGHAFSLTQGSMKAMTVRTRRMGDYTVLGGASSPDATAAAALKDLEHILAG